MKFSTRDDIEAPIDFVFEQLTDFPGLERAAMRRGAEVRRTDSLSQKGPGMSWHASFEFRGRTREVDLELTGVTPPDGIDMAFGSANLDGRMVVDLVALSRNRTRVTMNFELASKSLSGKLLLQSLKLARKSLTGRIDERMSSYCEDISKRFQQSA